MEVHHYRINGIDFTVEIYNKTDPLPSVLEGYLLTSASKKKPVKFNKIARITSPHKEDVSFIVMDCDNWDSMMNYLFSEEEYEIIELLKKLRPLMKTPPNE